jgi:hypothetical protein
MRFYKLLILLCSLNLHAQQIDFQVCYAENPLVPKGLLEAVAHTNTRMHVLDDHTASSCTGLPKAYGILGLFDETVTYFRSNGKLAENLSGISVGLQKADPQKQVDAYAKAFQFLMEEKSALSSEENLLVYQTLCELSEIPDSGKVNLFARDAQCYEILRFLNDPFKANQFNFSVHQYDLSFIFGVPNLAVLSAPKIRITEQSIQSVDGSAYAPMPANRSIQYEPAIWNPAATCNFSSRSGTAISAITIHTVQGTYAGCISWFQNCSAGVSAHYVIRSSDGQITQMVDEANKAWHVGSENPYTIGYEHEGYVDNASWYTNAMYSASADLSRDIVSSGYGIPALRTYFGDPGSVVNVVGNCTKIKGHQHYPNQTHTDPGINWNWEKYYRLINNAPLIQNLTASSGTFYDSGGELNAYANDERKVWVFEPSGVNTITLNFTTFDIENNWDFLFIYDGNSIDSPLLGKYTGTTSPGSITSSGGALTIEFRSDCASTNAGWSATYTSDVIFTDNLAPITSISPETGWRIQDFETTITDTDASGIVSRFALISDIDPSTAIISANNLLGYAYEDFETSMANWNTVTGPFSLTGGTVECTDATQNNSNLYLNIQQDSTTSYLYSWNQVFTSNNSNQRAGMHFFCDEPTLPNRGNSYFVFLRETDNVAQIYKVTNDTFSLVSAGNIELTTAINYNCKVIYEPSSGWIKCFINDSLTVQWQDIEPLQGGSAISLRTAGCTASFDNIKVFRSRSSILNVSLGTSGQMRFQSENAQASGRIYSLAMDLYENWSTEVFEDYLIDWSIPELDQLNDGAASDVDTFYTSLFEGNWVAHDLHSGIGEYQIAIGTLPALNDVFDWTSTGTTGSISQVLSAMSFGTTYHLSLRVINGAGLSEMFVSDGQTLVDPNASLSIAELLNDVHIYPNPASEWLFIDGWDQKMNILIYDGNGKLVHQGKTPVIDISKWASGNYTLMLSCGNRIQKRSVIIQ